MTLLHQRAVDGDLAARCLPQRAQGTFQKWPETFRGFVATVRCRADGREAVGRARVGLGGDAEVELARDQLRAWAADTLATLSGARTPRFFKDGGGRFPIAVDGDGCPGRRLRVDLGGGESRVYTVDEKARIRLEEHHGPGGRTTTVFDGFVRTSPGRVLPTSIRVFHWDSGADAHAGIQPGDVIVEVDHDRVANVSEFRREVEWHRAGAPMLVLLHRRGGSLFVALGA